MESQTMDIDLPIREATSVEGPSVESLLANVSSVLAKDKDIFAIGGHAHDGTTEIDTTFRNSKVAIRCEGYPTLRLPLADDVARDSFTLLNAPVTMDANNFCTDFNLAAYGILETINQTLPHSRHSKCRKAAVKAELCKLDVFSADSDTSQHLVNNPDLSCQMGSLVVCLSVAHKGGRLVIQHQDRQVEFDWASQHPDTIRWAAFFSACEHEVLPITEGHRVMLTYNLVWSTWGHGFMGLQRQLLDQESAYFYTYLEKLIEKIKSTGERKQSWPFSSYKKIDHMLKGIDMVVYQALVRLVGDVSVSMVLYDSSYVNNQLVIKEYELECQEQGDREWPLIYDTSDLKNTVCMDETPTPVIVFETYSEGDEDCRSMDPMRVKHRKCDYKRQKVTWLNYAPDRRTHRELSLVMHKITDSHSEVAMYHSSTAIFAWVGFPSEDDEVDESED